MAGADDRTEVGAKVDASGSYVDAQFEKFCSDLDRQFEEFRSDLGVQFEELHRRLAILERMLNAMIAILLVLAGMTFGMHWQVGELNGNVKMLEARFAGLDERVAEFDEELELRFPELDEETELRFTEIAERIEARFTKQDEILAEIRALLEQGLARPDGK